MTDDVSRVIALAWGAEVAPQRGPKRELSLERIVEAAIELADAEGLQAVTMQRVAQTFGYTTMAMYRYVANKDDLYRLMADAAVRGTMAIDDGDWRLGLEQWATWMLEMYTAHPWLLDIPLSTESLFMPEQTRVVDSALRAMRTLPAENDDKLFLLMFLSTFVRGHSALMREISRPDAVASEATKALVRDAVLTGRYPDLAPLVESGTYLIAPAEAPDPRSVAEQDLTMSLRVWFEGVAAVYAEDAEEEEPRESDDVEQTPEQAFETAEHELNAVTELRKATQKRVRELEKREAAVRKTRDAAKEAAKAAAKLRR
ncbi:TetR/AcrR family transcriptional regulator [uncultured Agrococcus sp.]|uniref:TetR/AcrR family transcriptional regulator n=1 Tax=uncultured Agrococcus sp. TaxID=382258 RepID=UPI0025E644F2|nr:TetR/AcrR family transcriptional regulator [uncultured Agrococcus sp.]